MKKYTLFFVNTIFLTNVGIAQTKLLNTEVSTENGIYVCNNIANNTKKVIYNKQNNINGNRQKLYQLDNLGLELIGKQTVLIAFTSVFSNKRLRELLPEKNVIVTYFINAKGNVIELSYILANPTMINAEEIESLDATLKQNLNFSMNETKVPEDKFISYTAGVYKILDRQKPYLLTHY